MYSFDGRVRYSEIDADRRLTIPGVINYFQDCSTFHSETLGLSVEWLFENHYCWVVSSWEIKIHRLPQLGEYIKVSTWPYEMNGFFGYRNFTIKDGEGMNLVEANSVWTYMDTEKQRPAKIDAISLERYSLEEPLKGEWMGRKIPVIEGGIKEKPIDVVKFLLDTNGHVNNAKYIVLAMEYVPEDFAVNHVRVEYKRSAQLGDRIIPRIVYNENQVVVFMEDENENIFVVVEFERGSRC